MTQLRLLGITGKKNCGKSTAARYLEIHHNFIRISFADPLKCMLAALGLSDEELWGDQKEIPSNLLNGQTPRHAVQTLGTEWGRNLIHKDIWISAWKLLVSKCPAPVVTDDLRYLNEAEAIKQLGGRILLLERSGIESTDTHSSEIEMEKISYDNKIVNGGSVTDLVLEVGEFLEELKRAKQREKQEERVESDGAKESYARNLTLPARDWKPTFERDVAHKGNEEKRATHLKE